MELPDRSEAKTWEGLPVVDLAGEPLGTCAAVFADTDTGIPEWLQVGETGEGRSFVPALDAGESAGTVTIAFPASAVRSAPRVGGLAELSKDDERRLYAHYGIPVSTAGTDSLLPADAEPASAPSAPPAPFPVTAALPATEPVATEPVAASPEPVVASSPPPPPAPSPLLAPPPPPATEQAPAPGSGLGAAAAPLGAAAALALAGGLAARALRNRSRRRNRPTARAGRSAASLSTRAASTAGAGRAQLLAAGSTAADVAAKRRKAAAKETAKRKKTAAKRRDAALTVGAERKQDAGKRMDAAVKGAAARKKDAGKRKDAAVKSAAARKKVARKRTDAATRAAATHASAASTAAATKLAATRKAASSTTSGLATAPRKAGRTVHKAQRGVARNLWQALVAGTAGAGYVLGAKAGTQRYAQIEQQASQLAATPPVQKVVNLVTDAERREQVKQTAEQQSAALLDKARSSS